MTTALDIAGVSLLAAAAGCAWPPAALVVFGVACLLASWLAARFRERRRFSVAVGQILALACLIHVSIQAHVADKETVHEWRGAARKIMAGVPPGSPLYILPWDYFSLFYYVERPVIHIRFLSELPSGAGEYFVVYGAEADRASWKKFRILGCEPVPLPKGAMMWILRLRGNPG